MAIVARFCFDVPFGRKADLLRLMKRFEPLQTELGFPKPLVGSHRWEVFRVRED